MAVYLIHFKTSISPLKTCQHYIGFANNIEARVEYHRKGQSQVRIFEVAKQRGVGFEVVRIWEDGDKTLERRLKKNGHYDKLCPVCRGKRRLQKEKLKYE